MRSPRTSTRAAKSVRPCACTSTAIRSSTCGVVKQSPGGRGNAPGITPGGSIGTGSAACVEQYSPTTLANRSFAFDGSVSAIDGEQVTFTIGTAYRGAAGGTITLDAPGMTGTAITSAGGPNLAVGERYLVAGDDHFVWACGYTQPYDAAVGAEWAAALGG